MALAGRALADPPGADADPRSATAVDSSAAAATDDRADDAFDRVTDDTTDNVPDDALTEIADDASEDVADDDEIADDAVVNGGIDVVSDETNRDVGGTASAASTDETARSAVDAGATFMEDALVATSGLIDVTSLHELEARHGRPSRWGRLDLAIAWRRIERVTEPNEPSRRHEVWLVATWRN